MVMNLGCKGPSASDDGPCFLGTGSSIMFSYTDVQILVILHWNAAIILALLG